MTTPLAAIDRVTKWVDEAAGGIAVNRAREPSRRRRDESVHDFDLLVANGLVVDGSLRLQDRIVRERMD